MTTDLSHPSALRERMIEDMSVRGFTEDTRRDYIRCVKALAAFIGRPRSTGPTFPAVSPLSASRARCRWC
jgi:hypothetical protein